ncbi:MAG: mannose-1-phosphate guanylyltransferase [Brevefilum sp.]
MYKNYYAVIMAGGSGTRLWPLSRQGRPKQSLKIVGDRTLFQHSVDRLLALFPYERILVVTVKKQVDLLRDDCPEIPFENYLIEPMPRGTASVVALAAIAIKNRDPNGTMAILTADHLIKNAEHLRELLKAAYEIAQNDYLTTLGITPDYPATGFGYIQKGDFLDEIRGVKIYQAEKFKEKPDKDQAEKFIAKGDHVWNSGMFVWKVETVLMEFERQMPDLFEKTLKIDKQWQSPAREATLQEVWPTLKKETIDYGIMENAHKVAVVPSVNLGWNDVGSWESLFEALETDEEGNILMRGEVVSFDTHGTLICEDETDRLIVTIGVDDLVIIESGRAVLVCDRKQAQRIRDVVKFLSQNDRDDYL